MKNYLLLFCVAFLMLSCKWSGRNDAKNKEKSSFEDLKLAVKIDEVSNYDKDLFRLRMRFICTNCEVLDKEVAMFNATYFFENEAQEVVYQENFGFLSLTSLSCENGLFEERKEFTIPRNRFKNEAHTLRVRLEDNNLPLRLVLRTDTFTIPDVTSKQEDKKGEQLPYLSAKNPSAIGDKRGVYVMATAIVNPGEEQKYYKFPDISAEYYVLFYKNGALCSNKHYTSVFVSTPTTEQIKIYIPYTSIYIPPGANELTYKIFAKTNNCPAKEMVAGKITIDQPQLYQFAFQTKNVEADVNGMDKAVFRLSMSSKSGAGIGDAYFRFENTSDVLFSSSEAKNSGRIANQSGVFQTYINESLILSFWEKDAFNSDFVDNYIIPKLEIGANSIKIKNQGKIISCDLSYQLTAVNSNNYRLLK